MSMDSAPEKIKAHIGGVELHKDGRVCDVRQYEYAYVSDIHF
jgi:hypothetical protein